jgi:hypothetical protein
VIIALLIIALLRQTHYLLHTHAHAHALHGHRPRGARREGWGGKGTEAVSEEVTEEVVLEEATEEAVSGEATEAVAAVAETEAAVALEAEADHEAILLGSDYGVDVLRHGVDVLRHGVDVLRHGVDVLRHGVDDHDAWGWGKCSFRRAKTTTAAAAALACRRMKAATWNQPWRRRGTRTRTSFFSGRESGPQH